ncbi:Hypothetical predicted protein, partial [Marmota monax]
AALAGGRPPLGHCPGHRRSSATRPVSRSFGKRLGESRIKLQVKQWMTGKVGAQKAPGIATGNP